MTNHSTIEQANEVARQYSKASGQKVAVYQCGSSSFVCALSSEGVKGILTGVFLEGASVATA